MHRTGPSKASRWEPAYLSAPTSTVKPREWTDSGRPVWVFSALMATFWRGYNKQIQITHEARRPAFLTSSAWIFAAIATTAVKSIELLKGKHEGWQAKMMTNPAVNHQLRIFWRWQMVCCRHLTPVMFVGLLSVPTAACTSWCSWQVRSSPGPCSSLLLVHALDRRSLAPLGRIVHVKAGFWDWRPSSGSINTCVIWRGLSSRSGTSQVQQLQAMPG